MEKMIDISICVISYNHEDYIIKTLESINRQKFNGKIQVVIGVDLSNDETKSLVEGFKFNPNFEVVLNLHDTRQGMFNNLFDVLSNAKGKYIAMLEGDDFWIDDLKLQIQYDFLEKNENCVLTGGNIKLLKESLESNIQWNTKFHQVYFLPDFVQANRLSFCTAMFRTNALDLDMLKKLKDSPHLDWPIYILLMQFRPNSFAKVFKNTLSAYRVHDGGVYSGVSELKRIENVRKTMLMIKTVLIDVTQIKNLNYSMTVKPKYPSIHDMRYKSALKWTFILSYLRHNYSKKDVLIVLARNFWLIPILTINIIQILIKRYF
jgi:glycosyltransferase involved in cell wall biosynthesis